LILLLLKELNNLLESVSDGLDFLDLISPGVHKVSKVLESGMGNISSNLEVSIEEVNLGVNNLDSSNAWDDNTSGEVSVNNGHVLINNTLKVSSELSGGEAESVLEVSSDGSDLGGWDVTEDLSVLGVDGSGGVDVIELNLDGGLTSDLDGPLN